MRPKQLIAAYGISSNSQLSEFAHTAGFTLADINLIEDFEIHGDGAYIINLGNREIGGTHWTGLWVEGRKAIYFDSFGAAPPDDVVERMRWYGIKQWWWNDRHEYQRVEEQLCGMWVLMFFHFMRANKELSLPDRYKKMSDRYADML